jgi:hypothetical protein
VNSNNAYHKLSDEEAADYALAMGDLEHKVIMLCSKSKSWGYSRLAEKIGASYRDVQSVGRMLQAKRLGYISVVRLGTEYHGSAIFLNERGESVKYAVEALVKIRINRGTR